MRDRMYDTPELNSSLYFQNLGVSSLEEIFKDFPIYPEAVLLMLDANLFSSVPPLFYTPRLQVLNLNNNVIEFVDFKIFENLAELREVYLSGNKITEISSKSSLPSILILKLNKNKLTQFPKLSLPNLQVLDLSDNQIDHQEDILPSFPQGLCQLYLYGNPWVGKVKNYRAQLICAFPHLVYLDRAFVDRPLAVASVEGQIPELCCDRKATRRREMAEMVRQMKENQL